MKLLSTLTILFLSLSILTACDDDPSGAKTELCDNQVDDDGDGFTDCDDQDCWSNAACTTNNANNVNNVNNINNINNVTNPEVCDNGNDDDGDGFTDCDDRDCDLDPTCEGGELCNNGNDDDGDGFTDCDDQDCVNHQACNYIPEICDDGFDNDGDSLIDCDDYLDCMEHPDCMMQREICDNAQDDDGDSLVDCEDEDCYWDPICGMEWEMVCDDGMDDDSDGLVDCEDPDCEWDPACDVTTGCEPIAQTGCTAPEACYLDAQNPDGYCTTAGETAIGTRCTTTTECVPGSACVGQQNNRFCRQLCLLGGGTTCTTGTCQPSTTLGSTTYGVCR